MVFQEETGGLNAKTAGHRHELGLLLHNNSIENIVFFPLSEAQIAILPVESVHGRSR